MFRFSTLLLCCLYGGALSAQDNAFSQFFANRMYLNPAFTGIEKGFQVTSGARSQWLRADGGYQFAAVTVEWQEDPWRSGFGFNMQYADEGISPLRTFGTGLSYAYILPYKKGNFHFGAQYAFYQKTLDWSRLTFSDQLDPVFGSIYGTSATLGIDKVSFHDFNAGILWRTDSKLMSGKRSIRKYRSHLGISFNHLASLFGQGPDESFLQTGTEIPARITVHGGTIIPLVFLNGASHKMVVSPNFRLETQGFAPLNLSQSVALFSAGAYFVFEQAVFGAYYNSRMPVPGLRNTNAISLSMGFTQPDKQLKKHSYYLGFSVDLNATGLGIRTGNVYEVNLRYNFRDVRPLSQKKQAATTRETVMECKDFY